MDLTTSVAVVTGANRGLGRQLAAQLAERGAKVYAAALDGLAAGVPEVLADELARHVKAGLSAIPAAV